MPLKFFYAVWNKYKTFKEEFLVLTCVNFVSRGLSKTETYCVDFSDSAGQRSRTVAISFHLAQVIYHMLEAGVLSLRGKNERRCREWKISTNVTRKRKLQIKIS